MDLFEGDEYLRSKVKVQIESKEFAETQTYLWIDNIARLSPTLWSFEDFARDKMHRWVGDGAGEEYAEVDRRIQMQGIIVASLAQASE